MLDQFAFLIDIYSNPWGISVELMRRLLCLVSRDCLFVRGGKRVLDASGAMVEERLSSVDVEGTQLKTSLAIQETGLKQENVMISGYMKQGFTHTKLATTEIVDSVSKFSRTQKIAFPRPMRCNGVGSASTQKAMEGPDRRLPRSSHRWHERGPDEVEFQKEQRVEKHLEAKRWAETSDI